jgi:predicted dehydrogenase
LPKKCIAIHGLGSIGMRHARSLIRMGHDVCGYDIDPARVNQLVATGGRADWPQHIDGVLVATPTAVHDATLGIYQKLSTVPIFVEKPIATAPVPITNIVMVGYNLRFHACVKKAREWIEAGHLGEPLWANLVCAQKNVKYRDSVVLNWSHEADLALYLIGGVDDVDRNVTASSINREEAIADICLTHDNGCRSTIHLDYVTEPEIRQTIIVGTNAAIILDLCNRHCWLRDKRNIYVDEINSPIDSWEENYYEEMAAFLDRIDGKETIGCTATEALKVLAICQTARDLSGLKPLSSACSSPKAANSVA